MTDETQFLEDSTSSYLEDGSQETEDASGITDHIYKLFSRAEDAKYQEESNWIRAYKNYRGIYSPDVQFTEAEKSRVFIKVTKTKVLAAYSQLVDVLNCKL